MNEKPATYKCEECNGVFEFGWTDEEAVAEMKNNGFDAYDCAVVCDGCYRNIMGEGNTG